MKIVFISRKFPPSTGGMEQFAYDLHHAIAAKIKVKLVKWGGSNKYLPVVIPWLWLKGLVTLIRGGIDLIHIQDGVLAPVGYTLSRLTRKPYTVVIHGLDITYDTFAYKVLVLWAVQRAGKVFCISEAAAEAARQRGVPADKVEAIPLAVNDTLYQTSSRAELIKKLDLPSNAKILLTVGRLVKRKGVAWFIQKVLPGLVVKHPDLVYLVVGEGEDRVNIEQAIKAAGMQTYVRLLGKVDGGLYGAVYNGADVFVMPNINVPGNMEGFGLVVLEAAVCGLPVVAASTEGIRDAIQDGQNGRLVPVMDAVAFQKAVEDFLNDLPAAKKFGMASRRFSLQNYRWDKIADRYIEGYHQALLQAEPKQPA